MAQADDLQGVLRTLERSAKSSGAKVSVDEIVEAFGPRSFGPLLLLCGLLGMTPVSAIPTAPSILALIVILIAGQMVAGRQTIWIPRFLGKLEVNAGRLKSAVAVSKTPATVVDKVVCARLTFLTTPLADRLVALACVLVALCVPPLELLPFAAFVPALAIFTFGIGMVARDGLVLLVALVLSGGVLGLIGWQVVGEARKRLSQARQRCGRGSVRAARPLSSLAVGPERRKGALRRPKRDRVQTRRRPKR